MRTYVDQMLVVPERLLSTSVFTSPLAEMLSAGADFLSRYTFTIDRLQAEAFSRLQSAVTDYSKKQAIIS